MLCYILRSLHHKGTNNNKSWLLLYYTYNNQQDTLLPSHQQKTIQNGRQFSYVASIHSTVDPCINRLTEMNHHSLLLIGYIIQTTDWSEIKCKTDHNVINKLTLCCTDTEKDKSQTGAVSTLVNKCQFHSSVDQSEPRC